MSIKIHMQKLKTYTSTAG